MQFVWGSPNASAKISLSSMFVLSCWLASGAEEEMQLVGATTKLGLMQLEAQALSGVA